MNEIEKMRKSTKIKLCVTILCMLIPIILLVVLGIFTNTKTISPVSKFLEIFRYPVCIMADLLMLIMVVNYGRILREDDYAANVLIKKRDERVRFIKQKTSTVTLRLLFFIGLIALIVSSFIEEAVFFTILVLTAIGLIGFLIIDLIYHKKY